MSTASCASRWYVSHANCSKTACSRLVSAAELTHARDEPGDPSSGMTHLTGHATGDTCSLRMSSVRAVGLPQCRQANAAPTVKIPIRSSGRPHLEAVGAGIDRPVTMGAAVEAAATSDDGNVVALTTLPSVAVGARQQSGGVRDENQVPVQCTAV